MSTWLRYVALIALPMAVPALAHAQPSAERAAQLNDAGKTLWQEQNDLAGAVDKFRQAVELDPDPRYYFNLCYALHQLGRFREAQPVCTEVRSRGDASQQQKAQVVLEDIEQKLAEMPPEADPGLEPGMDPGDGSVTTGPDAGTDPGDPAGMYGDRQPEPVAGLYQPPVLPDDYTWSVGAELGVGVSNLGAGDVVRRSAGVLKLFANFMLLSEQQIGAQGYVTFTSRPSAPTTTGENLTVVDLGGALYKHIPRGRYYMTPLLGVHLTGVAATNSTGEGIGTGGLHGELGFSTLLGPDRRHVVSVTPGLSLYLPASGTFAMLYGLDNASIALTVNVGYSLRFTTPFGQGSIITLE